MMQNGLAPARVLVLNWRDPAHPDAGGAEVYAWEMATRFAATGADVTYFTARHVGSVAEEMHSGVTVLRRGSRLGVYPAAARHMLAHRSHYDCVLDCQNGIPFFAPLFVDSRCAVVTVIHHVHQHQFRLHFPAPVAWLGRFLEKDVARRVYGRRPILVVSPSTRRDVRMQLGMRGSIHIVPNGIRRQPYPAEPRSSTPVITVVSRLVPQKRLELLIRAVPRLRKVWPDLTVHIAGAGPEHRRLRQRVEALGLQECVQLHGRVSEETKQVLLARAWVTVMPSVAEGWGLTVLEANSFGTPAVAYDVPGLRDAVRPGLTGWLLPEGSDLGDGIVHALDALRTAAAREAYAQQCAAWAASFSWERSADRAGRVLATELARVRERRSARRACDMGVLVDAQLHEKAPAEQRLVPLPATLAS